MGAQTWRDDSVFSYKDGGGGSGGTGRCALKIVGALTAITALYEQGMFENEPVSISKNHDISAIQSCDPCSLYRLLHGTMIGTR